MCAEWIRSLFCSSLLSWVFIIRQCVEFNLLEQGNKIVQRIPEIYSVPCIYNIEFWSSLEIFY